MSIELRSEDGSLNVYCVQCNAKLEATAQKLRELAESGAFETVSVLCPSCQAKLKFNVQFGVREHGKMG